MYSCGENIEKDKCLFSWLHDSFNSNDKNWSTKKDHLFLANKFDLMSIYYQSKSFHIHAKDFYLHINTK